MGMYTECFVRVEIEENTPPDVIEILRWMFDQDSGPCPESLPDHPFFACDRWAAIGHSGSFYHQPRPTSSMWLDQGKWYICSRSDLKNYDDEISKFFDWLQPYAEATPGDFIGYSLYEEDQTPTLILKRDPFPSLPEMLP